MLLSRTRMFRARCRNPGQLFLDLFLRILLLPEALLESYLFYSKFAQTPPYFFPSCSIQDKLQLSKFSHNNLNLLYLKQLKIYKYMPEKYIEQFESYKDNHELADRVRDTINIIKSNTKSGPEYGQSLEKMGDLLKKAREREEKALSDAKELAGGNSLEKTLMYKEAYEEYFNFLESQAEKASPERIDSILENIEGLEELLKSEQLRSKVEQSPIPEDLQKEFHGQQLSDLRVIFVDIFSQRLADLQMAPEGGFKAEDVNAMYQAAAAELRKIENSNSAVVETPEVVDAKPKLAGPTIKVGANPGWSGWFKTREQRKVSASRGIKS